MCSSQNKGAKFWLGVVTEMKSHGESDIFICYVGGPSGFVESLSESQGAAMHRAYGPQNQPQAQSLLQYGIALQAVLPGYPEHIPEMVSADQRLDRSLESIYH